MAERTIIISDSINEETVADAIEQIIDMNKSDNKNEETLKEFTREPIKLLINSGGGNVYDGLALVDVIRTSDTPIYTYCIGHAMSMAFWIYLAGHKRFAGKNCTFMYHEISYGCYGKLESHKLSAKESQRLQDMYDEFVIEKTSILRENLEDYKERKDEWYMSAEEGLKLGVCSELL